MKVGTGKATPMKESTVHSEHLYSKCPYKQAPKGRRGGTKILEFNPDRELDFDSNRPVQFDLNRSLAFSPNRILSFAPNRDLGFGKRGRMFRGYVCSNCEAPVSPLDAECTECGAVFETKRQIIAKQAPKTQPSVARETFCTYCGSQVEANHTYCGKCGMRIRTRSKADQTGKGGNPGSAASIRGYETMKLPSQKQKRTVVDWSETGKEFKDLVEK